MGSLNLLWILKVDFFKKGFIQPRHKKNWPLTVNETLIWAFQMFFSNGFLLYIIFKVCETSKTKKSPFRSQSPYEIRDLSLLQPKQ